MEYGHDEAYEVVGECEWWWWWWWIVVFALYATGTAIMVSILISTSILTSTTTTTPPPPPSLSIPPIIIPFSPLILLHLHPTNLPRPHQIRQKQRHKLIRQLHMRIKIQYPQQQQFSLQNRITEFIVFITVFTDA